MERGPYACAISVSEERMITQEVSNWGDAIFLAASNALNTFITAIPLVLGALLILIVGWIIASVVGRAVRALLERAGADRMFAQHGGDVYGKRSKQIKPSVVTSEIVKWIIRFVFLVAAANVLGMPQVSTLLNQVLLWIPNLLVAAVILLVAPLIGRFLRGLIEVGAGNMGFTNAPLLGRVAEIAVIAFAVLIAIDQIGIAADLLNILFTGLVAALALAFGLAFGLGGRDVAGQITQKWYEDTQAAAEKVRAAAEDQGAKPTPAARTSTPSSSAPERRHSTA
ncbi:MAG TPA: small-conductance mechanosensitive ion channel [Candidatus Limnocylindria bacterium]|nr:small-conductance mechanosensitive ion channel [Candidatus Limnocylindria bacterium]